MSGKHSFVDALLAILDEKHVVSKSGAKSKEIDDAQHLFQGFYDGAKVMLFHLPRANKVLFIFCAR